MNTIDPPTPRFAWIWPIGIVTLMLAAGCRTVPALGPVDLTGPGWTVREGQAAWHLRSVAVEMTGELLVAIHTNGATFLQLTKNPLPILTAQTIADRWQIEFHSGNRSYSGAGEPPRRLVWLHLPRILTGGPMRLSDDWAFRRIPGGAWLLTNAASGEFIEGFLVPGLPTRHVVRTNETLETIARHYGVDLSDLCAANPQLVPARLRAGETLRLPLP